MFSDRDLYEYDPRGDCCDDCGSEDVCASKGKRLYCAECFNAQCGRRVFNTDDAGFDWSPEDEEPGS